MAEGCSFGLTPQLDIKQILWEAQHRWLRSAEICEILRNYHKFPIAPEPPNKPPNGSLFLFDRKVLGYFQKDGHNWRKKKDGTTVKEAHEKLKAGSVDVLHCYYAHGEDNENFQRRSYWMLEEELMHIVLVHYREVKLEQTIEPPGKNSRVVDTVIYGREDDENLLQSDDYRGFDNSVIEIIGETLSKVGDAVIYGREDDKKKVIELLLSDDFSEFDISLVQITGAGGIGKSTLAYLVYSDSMICDYFNMKAWVHMPESIDVGRILKAIIESLTGISCYVTEINELKQIIGEELSGKRFLIVLDNLRNGTQSFWDSLMVSLSIGAKGSIVMVTSRIEIISDLMRSIRSYHLNSLSDKHCFSILLEYAFDKKDPCIFPELKRTGKHIVAKCEGNPLAAKAVGSLLHFNGSNLPAVSQYWKDVLESNFWKSNECLPALSLCYDYLPMHMKLCFRYCSLFPEGYIFEKDFLIRLWMSQGYLESMDGEAAEDIGINCFEELLRRSFFQCLHIYDARERKYGIHDLFHNFAKRSGVEDSTLFYIPGIISHISLVPRAVEALEYSRLSVQQSDLYTFLFIPRFASKWPGSAVHIKNISILDDLFTKFRYLRSLDLSNTDIKELPDSIERLKSLCYLSLNNTNIRMLPNSICSLDSLQTLELQDCSFLSDLPPNIKKLSNLRCLNVFKESGFISMPSGIGELRNLRTLSNFNVGKMGWHCGIADLQNLLDLRGSLYIAGLENVVSGAQANHANLKMKRCLKTLTLHWFQNGWESDVENEQNALDVIQHLQPHTNLEELIIHGYFGSQFPTWLGDPLFCNLVSLTLDSCYESIVLPPLGQLPSLRFLFLQKMDTVRTLGPEFCVSRSEVICGFPSLEILKLWEMSELEEWNWVRDGDFPQLRSLSISMCFKLLQLPPLNSLRELVFHCCDQLPEIPRLCSLEYLKIDGFQNLEFLSLPDDLPALKKLEINNCGRLSRLHGLSQLASIEHFRVSKCPHIQLNEQRPDDNQAMSISGGCSSSIVCSSEEVISPNEIFGGMAAEWVVGLEKLISSFSEYLEDQFRWQTDMKKELERLRGNLPMIEAVVIAATQAKIRDQNPALNKWLWELRDAIDEADNLLDEFEYMKHKEQVAKNMEETKMHSSITSFIFKTALKYCKFDELALKINPNLKRLKKVVQKLDRGSAEVITFLPLLKSTKQEQQEQHEQHFDLYKTRETGPLSKKDLIGRGKDKENVMRWLRQPSNGEQQTHITTTILFNNVSLLSIVGHGGMGKTTLLQHVFEDEMTKEFELKIWVCVSNNFDAKKVIADMLDYLKKERSRLESISTLQETLKSAVQFKKFLLVLDDIWEDEEERDKSKWENVLVPFAYGSLGSKILVTTRMDSVAAMIAKVTRKKMETIKLTGLDNDECLQLLKTHAFADVENLDDHKKLDCIAGEIVKRLSGSPLTAKVIGGVLNSSLDERHWITILNNDLWNAEFGQSSILSILKLSFIFLPKALQNCFAFCSIYPQDHMFYTDEIVQKWIALGFIQPPNLEDGRRYFDILVQKSFFDKFQDKDETYYKMHDLLHELAQFVSAQECLRVVADKKIFIRVPATIRHLSVTTSSPKVLREMKFKNLRSLHLVFENYDKDFGDVLTKFIKATRNIRLLHIDAPFLKMIPKTLGYLIHLRYLYINSDVTSLPSYLSNLYHLQFIFFPIFDRPLGDFTLPKLSGIGKLTSLQELNWFYVRNENGYKIGELKHMNKLHRLTVGLLENVKDAAEACNAQLWHKRNLTDLFLDWGRNNISMHQYPYGDTRKNIADPILDERILNILKPPYRNLKKLRINKYMGVWPARWMDNHDFIYDLEHVELHNCLEWQILPPFGRLPFLKFLRLFNMPNVLGFDPGVAAEDDCLFPRLIELHLINCRNLEELPYLPPMLEMLEIDSIGWKTMNFCRISKSIPLKILKVRRCPDLTHIYLADEIARLAALRDMTIVDCPNLISLGGNQEAETTENHQLILSNLCISDPSALSMEPLRSFTSIQRLKIERNDELVSFSNKAERWFLQGSSSLCDLHFGHLQSLEALPFSLESMSSLKALSVLFVPQVRLLPNMPASLEQLSLNDLESLQCLPSSLSTLSSLKFLYLINIPLLKTLPDLPPSLRVFGLDALDNLDCLPSCLPSLRRITIHNAPQLRELPDLPPSLDKLSIKNCHSELTEHYKKLSGSYWHKIAHIPNVSIE